MTNVMGEILQRPTSVAIHLNRDSLQQQYNSNGFGVQCGVENIIDFASVGLFHFVFVSEGIADPRTLIQLALKIEQKGNISHDSLTSTIVNSLKLLGLKEYVVGSLSEYLLIDLGNQQLQEVITSENWGFIYDYFQAKVEDKILGVFYFCIIGKDVHDTAKLHSKAYAIQERIKSFHPFMQIILNALQSC